MTAQTIRQELATVETREQLETLGRDALNYSAKLEGIREQLADILEQLAELEAIKEHTEKALEAVEEEQEALTEVIEDIAETQSDHEKKRLIDYLENAGRGTIEELREEIEIFYDDEIYTDLDDALENLSPQDAYRAGRDGDIDEYAELWTYDGWGSVESFDSWRDFFNDCIDVEEFAEWLLENYRETVERLIK